MVIWTIYTGFSVGADAAILFISKRKSSDDNRNNLVEKATILKIFKNAN